MTLHEGKFFFLERDCIATFGAEKGPAIYHRTEEAYQGLLSQANDCNNEAIRTHLRENLLPPLAYYQVLRQNGLGQTEALEYVKKETRQAAEMKKAQMQRLSSLPFAYEIYRLAVKGFMKKNFPSEGWETQWVRCDSQEIHFDLRRCIYQDVTKACGCPELCRVYCENDEISFSGLAPKILFRRAGTLADGASCCDFHFIKG